MSNRTIYRSKIRLFRIGVFPRLLFGFICQRLAAEGPDKTGIEAEARRHQDHCADQPAFPMYPAIGYLG